MVNIDLTKYGKPDTTTIESRIAAVSIFSAIKIAVTLKSPFKVNRFSAFIDVKNNTMHHELTDKEGVAIKGSSDFTEKDAKKWDISFLGKKPKDYVVISMDIKMGKLIIKCFNNDKTSNQIIINRE